MECLMKDLSNRIRCANFLRCGIVVHSEIEALRVISFCKLERCRIPRIIMRELVE